MADHPLTAVRSRRKEHGVHRCLLRLLVLAVLATSWRSDAFHIVGYVPEYRFSDLDWSGVIQQTTHLILFSVEPTAEGDLAGIDRFWLLRQSSSQFGLAMKSVGSRAPKVLISVGGQGRSAHFASVLADKPLRRRLARRIVQLLLDYPILSGIDLNWEAPQSAAQWRDLGKLAADIRERMSDTKIPLPGSPMLTMSYHPLTGAIEHFAALKSKSTGRSFVDYFDMCHAMSYSLFDESRRHATQKASLMAVEEWEKKGLPSGRLTLGMPFYGISRTTGSSMSWGEILDKEPSLKDRPDVDETEDNIYFNNAQTLAKKVRFAFRRKLGGVMIWELGQDKAPSSSESGSLLRHVFAAALEMLGTNGIHQESEGGWSDVLAWLPASEDNIVCGIAGMLGAYMLLKSVWFNTPVRDRAPRGTNDPPSEDLPEHVKLVKEHEARWEAMEAEQRKIEAERKSAKAAAAAAAAEPEAQAEGASKNTGTSEGSD